MNIIIVEDDISLCQGIEISLRENSRKFKLCHDIESAKHALKEQNYDLLILDINLPDGSGLEFCRKIRNNFSAPILFLTANDTELDIITGLETGGDDYITKPFSLAVLRARVNALLRRGSEKVNSKIEVGIFSFDFEKMIFKKEGESFELSKTEQKLLNILINNKGQTLSRQKLIEYIWIDGSDYVDENALSVAINRLRYKIEDNPAKPTYIKTIYGLGYKWTEES